MYKSFFFNEPLASSHIVADPTGPGPCTRVITGLSALLVMITLPWSLAFCIKVSTYLFLKYGIDTLVYLIVN